MIMYLPNSNNPFANVGGNSDNVSNGNAGVSYLNNQNGNTNSNNGGRPVTVPCHKLTKTDIYYVLLAPWQKKTKDNIIGSSTERERPEIGLKNGSTATW